jgi:hypothetical protein
MHSGSQQCVNVASCQVTFTAITRVQIPFGDANKANNLAHWAGLELICGDSGAAICCDHRSMHGRLGSNFQFGIRYCIAAASSLDPELKAL